MPRSRNCSPTDHRLTILIVVAVSIALFSYLPDQLNWNSEPKYDEEFQIVIRNDALVLDPSERDTSSSDEDTKNPNLLPFLFEKLPVNSVHAELLQTIPGIGVELSRRIIEERENNGVYISADDLTRVKGIGVKKVERLQQQLSFTH